MFVLTTLNLNGLRSAVSKGLPAWLADKAPDCMAVQELKAQAADLEAAGLLELAGLRGHFHCAAQKGYSGVGLYSRLEPSDVRLGLGMAEFDLEGRCIELRFDTPACKRSVLSVYFPSGTSGDVRQAAKYRFLDAMRAHWAQTLAGRTWVLCADVNIAHRAIDLKNWRGNQKNSGFLPQERAWMDSVLADGQVVDVYRHLHPEVAEDAYTWWSNRGQAWARNVGWRIDYQLASAALAERARSAHIEKAQRFSDHAPLTIAYDWDLC